MAESTVRNFYKPIKLFAEMNDIDLSWKKIVRVLPHGKKAADDRPPTVEEIKAIMKYGDRRIRPLILTYLSSGIRLGSWQYLQWKHVKEQEIGGKIVAAKLTVYNTKKKRWYFTFITLEAYKEVMDWMDYRAAAGEKITPESWVMRTKWQTTKVKHGVPLVTSPKRPLSDEAIKKLIERAMISGGVRHALPPGVRRHEVKLDHGYRKFFQTKADSKIKSLHVMMLMDHDTGLAASYSKPTYDELLQEYLKAANELTINKSTEVSEQTQELATQKELKEKEIKALREQVVQSERNMKELKEQWGEVKRDLSKYYSGFTNEDIRSQ